MLTHKSLDYWIKTLIVVLIAIIGNVSNIYAGEERYSNYIDVEPGQANDTIIVLDDRFGNPSEWDQIEQTAFVNNLLLFEVNEHGGKMISIPSTFTVNIEIGLWMADDNPMEEPPQKMLETLSFDYDPNTTAVTPYQSFERYTNGHKMRIIIKSVLSSSGGVDTAPDLRVSGEIHLNRYYHFDNDNFPSFNNLPHNVEVSDQFLVSWDEMPGAELYDLEWVHYDTESMIGAMIQSGNVPTDPDYNYLFKNNSTRVSVGANSFNVNLLYRWGYLILRIRGVRPIDDLREHSVWSTSNTTILHTLPLPQREDDINWQSSVVYAEEGKHIPSTQYFDGTMRNRQSVTLSNAIDRTIVGQTMYDYHGRPAVSILPVPTEESILGYQENFACDEFNQPFTKDVWEAADCIEEAPFITNSPAGQYYSGDNPRRTEGKNQYLPDANGYTYTMTEFTPDLTGRIQTQSGVGEAFVMGSGHETRYYYAKPTQRELDRLFGSDVGDANHYLKNGVMDPNGQLSLSYIDGHGRVIATALAGAIPDNVQQIDTGYVDPSISTTDILYNQVQGNELVSVYKFIVAAPGQHQFSYGLSSELYENGCTDLCFDCKYDLTIELSRTDCRDIEGEAKIVKTLSNYTLDELMNECTTSSMSIDIQDFTVNLDVGEHSISKRLTLSEESLDYYTEVFLLQPNCVPVLEELIATYMDDIDYTSCSIDCDACVVSLGTESEYIIMLQNAASEVGEPITEDQARRSYNLAVENCLRPCDVITECEAVYGMMLADVSKDGQYGQYDVDPSTGVYSLSDPASVLYNYDQLPEGVIYSDEDGSPSVVYNSNNEPLAPTELSLSDFLQRWQPSWAEALVQFHPEYCIYQDWCLADNFQSSEAWEEEIRGIDNYQDAINAEVINADGTFNDPYFEEGAQGYDCKDLRDSMMVSIVPSEPSTPGILDIAIDQVYGDDPNCLRGLGDGTSAQNDAVWEIYKNLYLGIRQQLVSKARNAIAATCTDPPIACIGNDCGESPNYYIDKQSRFTNIDLTGESMTLEEAEEKADEIEEMIIDACFVDCANNADVWLYQLNACLSGIDNKSIEDIKDRLIKICQLGCDLEHPLGASSTPAGQVTSYGDNSFEDVIRDILGDPAGNCDLDCNAYVITGIYPYDIDPYRGISVLGAQDMADDDCMCERIDELEACYSLDPQGFADFQSYLAKFSSYTLVQEDIDILKNYCVIKSGTDPCQVRPGDIVIPPILECGVCKECDDIVDLKTTFDVQCNASETSNYYAKLAQYLNYNLGWTLLEEDYVSFLEECGMTSICSAATVLCPSSPLLKQENIDPCEAHLEFQAATNAASAYTRLVEEARKTFRDGYTAKCLANMTETFNATMLTHEYHYTLYYYDQAGNLVQTVPPNGVSPIEEPTILASIDDNRKVDGANYIYPEHSFFTKFVYNSLNQVIRQISPDTDLKEFFYDDVGRLIVSQDGRQRELYDEDLNDEILPDSMAYSYTIYDDLGRITEVGEKSTTTPYTEELDFETWITEGDVSSRTHVTRTYYDEQPVFGQGAIDIDDAANLRTRVAAVTIETAFDDDESTYDYGTHYSYDASGNVKTLVQEIVELDSIGHRYKRMDYDYDYISGNVNAVYYQKGQADQFTHRYTYDENNRLSEVYTSLIHAHANPSGLNLLLWDRDAAYQYYDHGPLARVEIGEYRVQGMDYAYTLQGWIKGVNSSGLRADKDMGGDGLIDGIHEGVARDALGYSLNYYEEDYDPIEEFPFMGIEASAMNEASPGLYNGNIRHMTIHNKQLGDPIAYSYIYDQLHRIKGMTSHDNADLDNYVWGQTPGGPTKYSMAASYDGNGNILQMLRTGIKEEQISPFEISNIDYEYQPGTNKLVGTMDTIKCDPEIYVPSPTTDNTIITAGERIIATNIVDGAATVIFQAGEIVCLEPGFEVEAVSPGTFIAQNEECETKIENSTYVYDGTGNLIRNESGSSISWSPYGKVLAVKDIDMTQIVSFGYDATQNRSKKSVLNTATNISKDLFYVRDASGNTMAVYEHMQDTMIWQEQYLYGSSRLGGIKPLVELEAESDSTPTYIAEESISIGWKYYEMGNHLGNVLTVFNDRKEKIDEDADNEADYYEATILSATDYYPFGLDMPSRTFANNEYRYGFNGKEKDPGTEWGDGNHYDYGFRIYNPEIGKFLSVDPLTNDYPSWTPYAFAMNRVIDGIDLDGLEWKPVTQSDGSIWFEWDEENAYESSRTGECKLKTGYYKRAIIFHGYTTEELDENGIIQSDGFVQKTTASVTVFGENGFYSSFRGITTTSDPETNPIVQEGFYEGSPERMATSIFRDKLNLKIINPDGTDRLDLIGINPNHPERSPAYADGIYLHRTNNNGRCSGQISVGCQVIDGRDYDDFQRFYLNIDATHSLPPIEDIFIRAKQYGNAAIIIERRGDYSQINRLYEYSSELDFIGPLIPRANKFSRTPLIQE